VEIFLYTWPVAKIKKRKKMPNQRHVCEFAEFDGGGGYSEKK